MHRLLRKICTRSNNSSKHIKRFQICTEEREIPYVNFKSSTDVPVSVFSYLNLVTTTSNDHKRLDRVYDLLQSVRSDVLPVLWTDMMLI